MSKPPEIASGEPSQQDKTSVDLLTNDQIDQKARELLATLLLHNNNNFRQVNSLLIYYKQEARKTASPTHDDKANETVRVVLRAQEMLKALAGTSLPS